jgi:hypothetical protein
MQPLFMFRIQIPPSLCHSLESSYPHHPTFQNATKAEQKEAKHGFWNSTMPEFSEVLNTTKAAEKQAKDAELKANEAALAEVKAQIAAQRGGGGKN